MTTHRVALLWIAFLATLFVWQNFRSPASEVTSGRIVETLNTPNIRRSLSWYVTNSLPSLDPPLDCRIILNSTLHITKTKNCIAVQAPLSSLVAFGIFSGPTSHPAIVQDLRRFLWWSGNADHEKSFRFLPFDITLQNAQLKEPLEGTVQPIDIEVTIGPLSPLAKLLVAIPVDDASQEVLSQAIEQWKKREGENMRWELSYQKSLYGYFLPIAHDPIDRDWNLMTQEP